MAQHSDSDFHLPWAVIRPIKMTFVSKASLLPLSCKLATLVGNALIIAFSDDTLLDLSAEAKLSSIDKILTISAGALHAALITENGALFLRGRNEGAQLGPLCLQSKEYNGINRRSNSVSSAESPIVNVQDWTQMIILIKKPAQDTTFSQIADTLRNHKRPIHSAFAWKDISEDLIGVSLPSSASQSLLKTLQDRFALHPLKWLHAACGEAHTILSAKIEGLLSIVLAWGQNMCGQLGGIPSKLYLLEAGSVKEEERWLSPVIIRLDGQVKKLKCGGTTSAAILADGQCLIWGANDAKNIADNDDRFSLQCPVPFADKSPVRDIAMSNANLTTASLSAAGTLRLFGETELFLASEPRVWELSISANWRKIQKPRIGSKIFEFKLAIKSVHLGVAHVAILCQTRESQIVKILVDDTNAYAGAIFQISPKKLIEIIRAGVDQTLTPILPTVTDHILNSSELVPIQDIERKVGPYVAPASPTNDRPRPFTPTSQPTRASTGSTMFHKAATLVGESSLSGLAKVSEFLVKGIFEKGMEGMEVLLSDTLAKEDRLVLSEQLSIPLDNKPIGAPLQPRERPSIVQRMQTTPHVGHASPNYNALPNLRQSMRSKDWIDPSSPSSHSSAGDHEYILQGGPNMIHNTRIRPSALSMVSTSASSYGLRNTSYNPPLNRIARPRFAPAPPKMSTASAGSIGGGATFPFGAPSSDLKPLHSTNFRGRMRARP